ncbi:MAG: hypothetical protein SGPRY_007559 [Prymnesium sp.]
MLEISVSHPAQHGTLVDAYIDYKASTHTDLPCFTHPSFFVRRRFRDFQWLREQLCAAFPAAAVPPLPQLDSLLKDDRFSPEFIERRQAGLQLFLRRIARHQRLSCAPALLTFLEAKVWELQTAKHASYATAPSGPSSWVAALFDGTDASLKKIGVRQVGGGGGGGERPDEARITKLREYVSKHVDKVAAANAAHHTTVITQADAASDLNLLGRAGNLLSQSETELSLPFTHMASTLDAQRRLLEDHVQYERVCGLSSVLAFNSGLVNSLKTALGNHDRALDSYLRSQAILDASRSELQAWMAIQPSQGNERTQAQARPNSLYGSMMSRLDWIMDDPKKGERLEQKLVEAQEQLTEAKQATSVQ